MVLSLCWVWVSHLLGVYYLQWFGFVIFCFVLLFTLIFVCNLNDLVICLLFKYLNYCIIIELFIVALGYIDMKILFVELENDCICNVCSIHFSQFSRCTTM